MSIFRRGEFGLVNVGEEEAEPCPACGEENEPLGHLGKRTVYRCRACGMDYSNDSVENADAMANGTKLAKCCLCHEDTNVIVTSSGKFVHSSCEIRWLQQHPDADTYDNATSTPGERRNAQAFNGIRRYGALLNEWEGSAGGRTFKGTKPPESGRVVDATGKTLLIFHGYDHLLRWFVKEGIGDMATFVGLGYKFEG